MIQEINTCKCPNINHNKSPITRLCMNSVCKQQKAMCIYCRQEEHTDHYDDCYDLEQVLITVQQYLRGIDEMQKKKHSDQKKNKNTPAYNKIYGQVEKLQLDLIRKFDQQEPLSISEYKIFCPLMIKLKQILTQYYELRRPITQAQQQDNKQKLKKQKSEDNQEEYKFTFDQSFSQEDCVELQKLVNIIRCYAGSGEVFLKPDISKVDYLTVRVVFKVIQCQGVIGIGLKLDFKDQNMLCLYSNGEIKEPNLQKYKTFNFPPWQQGDLITVEVSKELQKISYLMSNKEPIILPIDKFMNCQLFCFVQDAILQIQGQQWSFE